MFNFHSNKTLDELLKEISHKNYDLFVELETKINQKIKDVYSKIESEQDEQENCALIAISAMECLCGDDLRWVKSETKTGIRYNVFGLDEGTHYDNHNISVFALKSKRDEWLVQISCGILGENGTSFKVYGNFKEAQKRAIESAKEQLRKGNHFTIIE